MPISRRDFVASAACGCFMCSAWAGTKALPTDLQPLIGTNYQPLDADERGLWQSCERLEEELATSELVLKADDLKTYTATIVERLLGRSAADLRIYILREASFNASMFPTGLMLVHTGLLVRARNEAQYASVLGHEAGHYYRKHSVEGYRDRRTKSAIGAFVAAGANVAAGASAAYGYDGSSWFDLANSINQALVASIYQFSRDQETEADAYGLMLVERAGYLPGSAAAVWRQLIEERQASAAHRKKKYRDGSASSYSTHPPGATRMEALAETAQELERGSSRSYDDHRASWQTAMAPYLPDLLHEQIKLNDPGASLYLVESLAQDGWTGLLRFYEGEVYRLRAADGDTARAASSYAAAVVFPDAPAEAWRAHGYALLRSGRREEGRTALKQYLTLRPDANDAAMVQMSLEM